MQWQMQAPLFGGDTDRISFLCEREAVMEWAGTDSAPGNKAETAHKTCSTASLDISPTHTEICMTM